MSDAVDIVVDVANHDRQCVCSTDGRVTAVLHNDWQMILLLLLPIKVPQTDHDAAAVTIFTATLAGTQRNTTFHLSE